jgi:NDP-4-keto-2,6-dideoxyhexose 3-C-methyltransferase
MDSHYTPVLECRLCKKGLLETVFDLGEQAIGSIFPKEGQPDPPTAPLTLTMCQTCGLVQLKHTVHSSHLYTDSYGYRSGLNNTMITHLKGLAEYVTTQFCPNPSVVIDIGCNDGTLLSCYPSSTERIGIDPCGNQFAQYHPKDMYLIPDFFTSKVTKQLNGRKANIITSISMFYDLPDPVQFARDIESILDDEGIWVMEQSYLLTMLERNSFDTICHEHLEYYNLSQIQWICLETNLKIIDVQFNDINGGSFRVAIAKNTSRTHVQKPVVFDVLLEESRIDIGKMFEEFHERCEEQKRKLMTFIEVNQKAGARFAIYGASTKGNTLLQYYGITREHIVEGVAERNPQKYGCRTPCTNIPIFSEEHVRSVSPDYMLVLPWHFKKEFIKREQKYLESGGQLVFPLPYFELASLSKIQV